MITRRLVMVLAVAAMMVGVTAPAALANDQTTKEDAGWGCGEAVGLPPGHCISPGTVKNWEKIVTRGQTFQLLVFDQDGEFLTSEIATFKPSADDRPCPHDPDPRNTDGTYWAFFDSGLYVCHHQAG